jgi:hypothetical protein
MKNYSSKRGFNLIYFNGATLYQGEKFKLILKDMQRSVIDMPPEGLKPGKLYFTTDDGKQVELGGVASIEVDTTIDASNQVTEKYYHSGSFEATAVLTEEATNFFKKMVESMKKKKVRQMPGKSK